MPKYEQALIVDRAHHLTVARDNLTAALGVLTTYEELGYFHSLTRTLHMMSYAQQRIAWLIDIQLKLDELKQEQEDEETQG